MCTAGSPTKNYNYYIIQRLTQPIDNDDRSTLSNHGQQNSIKGSKQNKNYGSGKIGLQDLDKDASEKLEKAYHNSFKTVERFNMLKSDFMHMKKELTDMVTNFIKDIRHETKTALREQHIFIEQTTADNSEMLGKS